MKNALTDKIRIPAALWTGLKRVGIAPAEVIRRANVPVGVIRELVEAYAHCADRRDAKGQMALFTENTHFMVFMNAKAPKPSQEIHSRDALAAVFADLNNYDVTTHFVGQSTILTLIADRATGEAYCLAHHVTVDGGKRRLMVASLRYLDSFIRLTALGCSRSACSTWTGWRGVPCHE